MSNAFARNRYLLNISNRKLYSSVTNSGETAKRLLYKAFPIKQKPVLRENISASVSTLISNCFIINSRKFYSTIASNMPPINFDYINNLINNNRVVIFSKTYCPYCQQVKSLFESENVIPVVYELDELSNGSEIQSALYAKVNRNSVPQVFVNGRHIGGCDDTIQARDDGTLTKLLTGDAFDYDLIVVGGGSGGLSASKEATKYGKKVALLDFVTPTPNGTTWGLGGTCVNVGCIPKKLMHYAALLYGHLQDAYYFGWETTDAKPFELNNTVNHNWIRMKDEINDHIRSLNFGYRVQLREKAVNYINAYGKFIDQHRIKLTDKKGKESILSSQHFIIATGERPRYPTDCVGAKEYSITSDDLFSLPYNPGKTLVIGASYVALECAGFLRGIGLDVTVMVRSILLRGFDQEMAEKVGGFMAEEGVKFIRPCVPNKIELIESGEPGRVKVTATMNDKAGTEVVDEYNTVLFAIGRDPCTDNIGLENTGVIREKNGKIKVVNEQTNVPNIYAVGDVLDGKPELTPVAIEAGVRLARRLYNNSDVQCDYLNVPTTVFTPLEYGSCGYSEEAANAEFGEDNLEIYIANFVPFEWRRLAHRPLNACFAKLICLKTENERIVGFHYLGPNAGEVTQLIGLPLKMRATKQDIDALIGIHPTCAEIFTSLTVTKRSGEDPQVKGCCG